MAGVAETVLARIAALAAESLFKRVRRVATTRGFVKTAEIKAKQAITTQQTGYWPASLARLLPPGRTQKDIDRFIQTPEFESFTRQLIARNMIDVERIQKDVVFDAIRRFLAQTLPPDPPPKDRDRTPTQEDEVELYRQQLEKYGIELCAHLDQACQHVAENIRNYADNHHHAYMWAVGQVSMQILDSIDTSLKHLSNPEADLSWTTRYRDVFLNYHREITSPDVANRSAVDYKKLFVGPTVLDADPDTLRPIDDVDFSDRSGSFDRLIRTLDRSVLLGDPGAGKSTSSTVVALESLQDSRTIPFIVILRDIGTPDFYLADLLAKILRERYEVNVSIASIEKLLHEGNSLVVFDGLDEVTHNSDRANFAKKIEILATSYPFLRILVTCRKVGYAAARLKRENFSTFLIGSFAEDQIEKYLHNWFTSQPDSSQSKVEHSVRDFMLASLEMRDLVENPLLLAFMCVLYRGLGSIPTDRASLYDRCVQLLIDDRDKHYRIVTDLPNPSITKTALSRIAHVESERGITSGLSEEQITKDLIPFLLTNSFSGQQRAGDFVRQMLDRCRGRAWMFTDFGADQHQHDLFTFTHTSFREYFGALYFVKTNQEVDKYIDHLYPLILAGRSEIHAQICCVLLEEFWAGSASKVLLGLTERLESEWPVSLTWTKENSTQEEVLTTRSEASAYLARLANCVPLTADIMDKLVHMSLIQISLGDSAAVARMLEPSARHYESFVESICRDLILSIENSSNDQYARRQIWFAIHARYLSTSALNAAPLKGVAVQALDRIVDQISPHIQTFREANQTDPSMYTMMIESGGLASETIGFMEPDEFTELLRFLWEEVHPPLAGVGPIAVIRWIFDCFRSEHRVAMPIIRVSRFARSLGVGMVKHRQLLSALRLPTHPSVTHFDYKPMLARLVPYSAELRSSILLLIAAQTELNDRVDPSNRLNITRESVSEWSRRLGGEREMLNIIQEWADGRDFWDTPVKHMG